MSEGDSLLEDSWSVSVPRSPTEGQGRGRYRSIISREATLNSYHSEEYKSERTQRVALTLIQLCHLCVWSIACASLLWFPKAVEISNGLVSKLALWDSTCVILSPTKLELLGPTWDIELISLLQTY